MIDFLAWLTALMIFGRCTIPGHALSYAGTVEALSHIFVGVLLVLALSPQFSRSTRGWSAFFLLSATAFETFMFLTRVK